MGILNLEAARGFRGQYKLRLDNFLANHAGSVLDAVECRRRMLLLSRELLGGLRRIVGSYRRPILNAHKEHFGGGRVRSEVVILGTGGEPGLERRLRPRTRRRRRKDDAGTGSELGQERQPPRQPPRLRRWRRKEVAIAFSRGQQTQRSRHRLRRCRKLGQW